MRHLDIGINGLRAALTAAGLAVCVLAGASWAQTSGENRYLPERSREDYGSAPVAEDGFDYGAQTLRAAVWLDRDEDEIYRRGDEQRVTFQVNEDAYAVVYRIDTDGLVTVLWPRDRLDDGFVFGGHEYRLPGRESAALRVDESEGEGYVQALVSRYPFDLRALELDFLGDADRDRYGFRVAGDPFLAMNEVNYAITGLEDSRDHVITNHARYYVHRVVDHPRYLCSQCHDDVAGRYDPYDGHCTLNIEYDYGWGNRWYSNYGYYPVYWNPVYVYVDPWTWRPWVNFWYDPWYVCAPWQGWRGAYWGSYTWYDSPYYRGGCSSRWDDGDRRYRPLNRHGDAVAVRKSHEFDKVSRQIARSRPESGERDAMVARRPVAGRDAIGKGTDRNGGSRSPVTVARGDKPLDRGNDRFPAATQARTGGGLRIRPDRGSPAPAAAADKPSRRHTAGGSERAPSLAPVRPGGNRSGDGTPVRGESGAVRGGDAGNARDQDRDGVRALNPRQRGTRVWNSTTGRGGQPAERNPRADSPSRARSGDDSRRRDDSPATAPDERPVRGREQRGQDQRVRDQRAPAPRGQDSRVRESKDERPAESGARSGEAPRSVRQAPRQRQETAPAPTRQEAPRRDPPRQDTPRQDTPRSRDSGEAGAARERGGDKSEAKPAEAPARRGPAEGRR